MKDLIKQKNHELNIFESENLKLKESMIDSKKRFEIEREKKTLEIKELYESVYKSRSNLRYKIINEKKFHKFFIIINFEKKIQEI